MLKVLIDWTFVIDLREKEKMENKMYQRNTHTQTEVETEKWTILANVDDRITLSWNTSYLINSNIIQSWKRNQYQMIIIKINFIRV